MKKLKNIHPGEVLKEEFLIPLGISAYRLCMDIGVPQTRISEILKGNRSITADTALVKGTPMLRNGSWVIYVAPTPNPTPTDNNQKPKVDENVKRVVASIEPSTNSNSSSNQSLPNSLNSNIRTLSFNGVDETRVINGGVKMPENIANEEDIIK